jgi:hypothetical protein
MQKLSVCGDFLLSKPVVFRLVDHRPASTVTAAGTNGGLSYSVYSGSGSRINGTVFLETNPAEIEVGDRWYLVQVSIGRFFDCAQCTETVLFTNGDSGNRLRLRCLNSTLVIIPISFHCDISGRVTEGTEGESERVGLDKMCSVVGNRKRGWRIGGGGQKE